MEYTGPNPRYTQYTKGYSTVGKNTYQNGTVEYTRFGSEYFSGANVGIYFGDILVDEIFGLQFNLQEQCIPVFGYGSYTYDAVAKGQRIINGSFNVYFKESSYMRMILNEIEYQSEGSAKANPFKYDTVPEETTIENILGQLNSKSASEFEKLATSYEEAIWGTKDTSYTQLLKDRPTQPYFTPFKDKTLNDKGFDILIAYGPEARRQKSNLGNLSAKTTVQSINGVHITSVGLQMDATGQPLFEAYTFIAKDINENIHNDSNSMSNKGGTQPEDIYAILRIGMQGSRVKALQEGLNTFFSEAATGNVAFQNWLANNSYLKSGQISTDGIFSAQTKEAVKVFQEYWSLAVDGIVGKDTWTALYNHNYVTK